MDEWRALTVSRIFLAPSKNEKAHIRQNTSPKIIIIIKQIIKIVHGRYNNIIILLSLLFFYILTSDL